MSLAPAKLTRMAPAADDPRPALARLAFGAVAMAALMLTWASPAWAQDGEAQPNLIRDTEVEETLHAEADPIFIAAGLNPREMKLLLVQDKELNAFTVSGQIMGINTGLIEQTQNPNQLIGVMAHETGHAAGGHPVREGEMAHAGLRPMILTLGLGLLAAAAGAPEAAAALLSSSPYFGELGALTYSREQESRADQAAITYLTKAHESPRGLVDFFDNFRYQEVFSEARRYKFFQSHPITGERIELLRRRAEEQPYYNAVDPPELIARHEVMRAKLEAFIEPPVTTLQKYPETDLSFAGRYARAIAYYKAGETDTAIRLIDKLVADYPTNPYLFELKGQVLFEAGRVAESEAPHRRAVELKPSAPLLRINLAQSIIAQDNGKRADEAILQLQKALAVEDDNSFAWRLMAQAYDAKGDGGDARLASAEQSFADGDLSRARIFALRARELLHRDTPQWRRATDIVLVSKPSKDDLKALSRQTGVAAG